MVREARLQLALAPHGIRLPTIRAVCEDERVIGVPFYVMDYLDGADRHRRAPAGSGDRGRAARARARPRRHAGRDPRRRRPVARASPTSSAEGSYLERQVRRFTQLWEVNQTRELPAVVEVGELARGEPARAGAARRRPRRLPARQHDPGRGPADPDPRRARLGDGRGRRSRAPTSATCSPPTASRAARRTRSAPRRSLRRRASRPGGELVERYVERSGRDVEPLAWFQALALWKAAVFCEAIYGRFIRGELAAEDTGAARFEQGVPLLAETALALIE